MNATWPVRYDILFWFYPKSKNRHSGPTVLTHSLTGITHPLTGISGRWPNAFPGVVAVRETADLINRISQIPEINSLP